jgi:hypothetical protein
MSARNRVGIGLSYRPARLNSLAELVPWYRFLGSLKVKKFGLGNILTAPQTRGLQRRAACPLSVWPTLRDGVLPPSQLRECVRRGTPGGSLRSHPATSELCQVYRQWANGGGGSLGTQNVSACMTTKPEAGVLGEPYSGKPAQRSSHTTGPPGYIG